MFQFARLHSDTYVFSTGWHRITGAGFPHSEIRGSKAVQRLAAAYRSRPRPSSAPGAKASTVRPYYLDGELARIFDPGRLVTTYFNIGHCAVFKLHPESAGHEGQRSLKTEQRDGLAAAEPGRR